MHQKLDLLQICSSRYDANFGEKGLNVGKRPVNYFFADSLVNISP